MLYYILSETPVVELMYYQSLQGISAACSHSKPASATPSKRIAPKKGKYFYITALTLSIAGICDIITVPVFQCCYIL